MSYDDGLEHSYKCKSHQVVHCPFDRNTIIITSLGYSLAALVHGRKWRKEESKRGK